MAKYKINYSCGCSGIVQIYGSVDVRTAKAGELRLQKCPACASREAGIRAAEKGLVPLDGSPKQILWAESIRMDASDLYEELHRRCGDNIPHRKELDMLFMEPSAHWWIQNRNHFKCFNAFLLFVNGILAA